VIARPKSRGGKKLRLWAVEDGGGIRVGREEGRKGKRRGDGEKVMDGDEQLKKQQKRIGGHI